MTGTMVTRQVLTTVPVQQCRRQSLLLRQKFQLQNELPFATQGTYHVRKVAIRPLQKSYCRLERTHRQQQGSSNFLPPAITFSHRTYRSFSNSSSSSSATSFCSSQHSEEQEQQQQQDSFKVTQMDYSNGHMTTINLPPAEILKRTSILPRDLVSLNLTSQQERYGNGIVGNVGTPLRGGAKFGFRPPTAILPRKDCILLSFGNVRAVAGRESVYIMDAHSEIAKSFAEDLSTLFPLKASAATTASSPNDDILEGPELVFLEAVLRDTLDTYTRRVKLLEPIVDNFVRRVSTEVFSDAGVHLLVPLKDSLQGFELHVKQTLDCLTELLNDDEEMLKLLLTEQEAARKLGKEIDFDRHQDVELLVGVYARQFNNLLQEINYLLSRLQSKQEFVALALAGYRNRLVRMNVNISIIGLSTGIVTAVAGFFGMNLVSGLEDSPPYLFWAVTGMSSTTSLFVAAMYFNFMSGASMQKRAEQKLAEIETLNSALSDMCALDYTIKRMVQGQLRMTKEEFRSRLIEARQTQTATDAEVDLLFEILDTHKDDHLTSEDFGFKTK